MPEADIPPPATSWFPLLPRFRCKTCQAAWWTRIGYRGHYALEHIVEAVS
jgi:hypothetical protein